MSSARPAILIAAPASVIRELRGLLADEARALGAESWKEALSRLDRATPDLVILCYAFDEARPYRLLRYLRDEWCRARVPVILVRTLPLPLGRTRDDDIRAAYKALGADDFFNLHGEAQRLGWKAALLEFREFVLDRLPVRGGSYARAAGTVGHEQHPSR